MPVRDLSRFFPTNLTASISPTVLVVSVLASLGSTSARAGTLYGFTATSMVSFDTAAPGSFTTIGAHGFSSDVQIISPTFDPSNGRVYAFGYRAVSGGYEQSFIEFSLSTGAGTTVANLGLSTTQAYEALAYHSGLGIMVASQSTLGQFNPTPRLGSMSTLGVFGLLSNNSRDNDLATYDASRGIFYTFDVQAFPNQAFVVNPLTGGTSDAGSILQTLFGAAWSSADDAIYGVRTDSTQLVRVAQGTSFATADIGELAAPLSGIFTIPTPSATALLGLGGVMAARRRR